MKTIRCIRNVIEHGPLYLTKGKTAEVSDELAAQLIKAKHAEEVKPAKSETKADK